MISKNTIKTLGASAEAMGQKTSPSALALMAADLDGYADQQIIDALKTLRRKGGRFCLSAILDNILTQDGRPSPDRAWAMFPKDEATTAVVTDEMMSAWSVACSQYDNGDTVGASIAFKREYAALIDKARNNNTAVKWFPSIGHDEASRADVLINAVAEKRLGIDHAMSLLEGTKGARQRLHAVAVTLGQSEAVKRLQGPECDPKELIDTLKQKVLDNG